MFNVQSRQTSHYKINSYANQKHNLKTQITFVSLYNVSLCQDRGETWLACVKIATNITTYDVILTIQESNSIHVQKNVEDVTKIII